MNPRVSVRRPVKGRIEIRMPYAKNNRWLLEEWCGERTRPEWNRGTGCWEVARNHLQAVLLGLTQAHGQVALELEGLRRDFCTQACAGANPDTVWDCVCCCAGRSHGTGVPYAGTGPGDLLIGPSERVVRRVIVTLDSRGRLVMTDVL